MFFSTWMCKSFFIQFPIILDLDSFECIVRSFDYNSSIYSKKKERLVNLNRES